MSERDERGTSEERERTTSSDEDVLLFRYRSGAIGLKAVTWAGEPVELTTGQARELALLLLRMAAGEDP